MLRAERKRTLKRETAAIKASLAHLDLEPLRQRHASANYAKFLELDKWIPYNLRIVRELDLFDAAPATVLDIGCGGGLLLYCLGYYGHHGIGTDIEDPLFADLATTLGVDRRISPVEPLRPLEAFLPPGSFDLITLVLLQFDARRRDMPEWRVKEWHFFLNDLRRRLSPAGRLYLRLGHHRPAEVQRAFSHGYAPPSKHSDHREFIFDQTNLRLAVETLEAIKERDDAPAAV